MNMIKKCRKGLALAQLQSSAFRYFPDLKEFLTEVELFLNDKERLIDKHADEIFNDNLPDDLGLSNLEELSLLLSRYTDTFPQILRYSIFIMLMSITEDRIASLCDGVRQIADLQDSFNRKKSKAINRAIEYLVKHTGIDIHNYSNLTQHVDSLRKLRNCIVHSKGRIDWRCDEEAGDLRKFINQNKNIEIDSLEKVVLLNGFIEESTGKIQLLMEKLLESIAVKIELQQDDSSIAKHKKIFSSNNL